MFRRNKDIDIQGGKLLSEREHMAALQNKNATTLLELLGTAPPIPTEIIPEDTQSHYVKNQIIKTIKSGGQWVGRMTGITQLPSQLMSVSRQYQQRFVDQVEFALDGVFLPMKRFANEVVWQYESQLAPYPTGAGLGGMIGGVAGGALGFYIGGPTGAAILSGATEAVGSAYGANAEKSWNKWMRPLTSGQPVPWWWWIVAPFIWIYETVSGGSITSPVPTQKPGTVGNLPNYRTVGGGPPSQERIRQQSITRLITKLETLEARLY